MKILAKSGGGRKVRQSMVYGFIYEKKNVMRNIFFNCLTNDIDDQCIFLFFCFFIKFSHGDFSYFDTMFYPWHYTCTFSYLNQIKNLRSNQIIRMIVHFLFCKFHNMCFFLLIYWPFKEVRLFCWSRVLRKLLLNHTLWTDHVIN